MTPPPGAPRPVEPGDPTVGGRYPVPPAGTPAGPTTGPPGGPHPGAHNGPPGGPPHGPSTGRPAGPGPRQRSSLPVVRIVAVGVALTVVLVGTLAVVSTFFVRKERLVKPITGTVTAVSVTEDVGDVVVRAIPAGGDVRVIAEVTDAFADSSWSAEVRDGTLEAEGSCDNGVGISIFDCSVDLTLEVPEGIPVTIRTDTGDVRLDGEFRATTVTTATGDVAVQRITGPLNVETDTGDVRADATTARSVAVASSTGDIRLDLAARPDDVRLRTDTGDVRVVVPDDAASYAVQTDTDTGDTAVGVTNDPAARNRMDVETSTGDIRVDYT